MNAKLSLVIGAYRDGSWYLATVSTEFGEGPPEGRSTVVTQRVLQADHVEDLAVQAVRRLVSREQVRHQREQRAAAERE